MLRAIRRALLFSFTIAALLATSSLIVSYSAKAWNRGPASGANESAAGASENSPGCCGGETGDDRRHLLAASYYSFKDGLVSTMLLNNKGPRPLEVSPTLFSTGGERLDIAPVTVEANSFRMVDMREWVSSAGPQFREGSVQIFHLGRDLVLGAQVFVTDEARSLSFEEKLVEPVTFKSSRLEGLWWLPGPKGKVLLAVSNVTDAQTQATITVRGERPRRNTQTLIDLAPHETRVLDVQHDLTGHGQGAMSQVGGISITHSGEKGGVLARAFARESAAGYSLAVQFSEPAAAKSAKLQGAGMRVGRVGGKRLTPVFIARNVGDVETTVTGRLPFTAAAGSVSNITLPAFSLAPGEMSVVDASREVRAAGLTGETAYTGVEFEYTSAPGSVTITALSYGRGGDQVFRVPLWDIHAQRSSTGGYPWSIAGDSSTIVYIKNTADHAQRYFLQLNHPGGVYSVGVKTIEGGQTAAYDLREMRDEQAAGAQGELIPTDAGGGQLHWSKVGNEEGVLIGRSEQSDTARGVSSNYACANCCNDNPTDGRVSPSSAEGVVGGTQTLTATERLRDCYGGVSEPMEVFNATWHSSNDAVASVSLGQVTGQAPGTATITAQWNATSYTYEDDTIEFGNYGGLGGSGHCELGSTPMNAAATYKVYRIAIKRNGTDITGTAQDVIVGHQISLTGEVLPAGTSSTSPQWTIPGNRIANYVVICNGPLDTDGTTICGSPTSGTATPLTNLTGGNVDYYWVDGATTVRSPIPFRLTELGSPEQQHSTSRDQWHR